MYTSTAVYVLERGAWRCVESQNPYQRIFCCMIHTPVHIYCRVRTRQAWGVEMRRHQNPSYRPCSGIARRTTVIFFCLAFLCPLYLPSPVSGTVPRISFLLLYCCCIIVNTFWLRGLLMDVFLLLCAVLYYCRTTYFCGTAVTVIQGGWVDRFAAVSVGLWLSLF